MKDERLPEMVADYTILLPQTPSLITNPKRESHPLALQNTLNLVAWRVSGIQSYTETFQNTLLQSSAQHRGKAQRRATAQRGILGSAGVLNSPLIQPLDMSYSS